jgi:molybdate transport system ATP-binding protein
MSAATDRLCIGVHKRLGALELSVDVDLALRGLTAVFGASGAGKSTLLNLIAGLHTPDAGRIAVGDTVFFDAVDGTNLPIEQRGLGMVFQDARLFPHLTVRGNLLFGLKRAGGRTSATDITLDQVIDLLGIASLLERRPYRLSGGEKQRVALGRALLARPRLLLMDEPLASLDAARKNEILPYIERLRDEIALPIVYVSHALDEVLRLATSMIALDGGRVVALGSATDVLAAPALRGLIGGADIGTLVFGHVSGHDDGYGLSTLNCDGFELRVPRIALGVGTPVRARIPAREVALALARPSDVSISNRLAGTVDAIEPRDATYADVLVRLGPATVLRATITRESTARLALVPGLPVWCLVKSVALDAGALVLARGVAAMRAPSAANDAQVASPR